MGYKNIWSWHQLLRHKIVQKQIDYPHKYADFSQHMMKLDTDSVKRLSHAQRQALQYHDNLNCRLLPPGQHQNYILLKMSPFKTDQASNKIIVHKNTIYQRPILTALNYYPAML